MSKVKVELIDAVKARDMRAIARMISIIENNQVDKQSYLSSLYKEVNKAKFIGFTGSPGSGKSTLVDQVAKQLIKQKKKVAILAVDPTSPFTGGAILGDRIRMNAASENEEVFIRSMATRGALGGLTKATQDVLVVLNAAGFDYVLIETVGVGQVEVDVVQNVDTCIVVLVPGMGDAVQTFKAGIIEIADLFVINKSDREGADLVHKDLNLLLSLKDYSKEEWRPNITKTIATSGDGSLELVKVIHEHNHWLDSSNQRELKRKAIIKNTIMRNFTDSLLDRVMKKVEGDIHQYVDECYEKKMDPYLAAKKMMDKI